MEYVLGPVLSVLVALGYIKKTALEYKKDIHDTLEKIEEVESRLTLLATKVDGVDQEVLKKSLKIITPLAQATQRLQDAVGVK